MKVNKSNNYEFLKSLIGLTKEQGTEICFENDFMTRVIREDDHNFVCTMDFRFDRINLEIDHGFITACDIG